MPGLVSTLSLQVAGLKVVYIINDDIHFEFENKNTLNKAKKKVARLHNKCSAELFSISKRQIFAFGISSKPVDTVIVFPIIESIQRIATKMLSGRPKQIPIVQLHLD